MNQSHTTIKNTTEAMNKLVGTFDKEHWEKKIVELDQDKGQEVLRPSRRTRGNLKRKA